MVRAAFDFETPYGTFSLARYPARPRETLFAWNSADSLLLEETYRRDIGGERILVANDAYGALCVALRPNALWTDSALAALALKQNELANDRGVTPITWSTQAPPQEPTLVVLRIPKQLAFFEYQLALLARLLPPGATVLAAGMDKHLSPHTAETLERFIGPTERRRGQRKGRLFCATRDKRPATKYNGTTTYYCEALRAELQGLANVFSREKLDPGTRFLLQQLCHFSPVEAAIDLACGNGVLGLTAARQGLAQRVLCCDESAMAFASTRANVERLFPQEANRFNFHHGDGLWGYTGRGADLILCNPPFHREHTVDEFSGQHLIEQCKQHLLPAGQLCIVVNRHLDYLPTLRRSFQRVEKIAANAKFNIFLAGEP